MMFSKTINLYRATKIIKKEQQKKKSRAENCINSIENLLSFNRKVE
jgi:hypothetical protein